MVLGLDMSSKKVNRAVTGAKCGVGYVEIMEIMENARLGISSTPRCKGSNHWTTCFALRPFRAPPAISTELDNLTYSSTRTGLECTGLIKGLKGARKPPTCVTVVDMVGGLTLEARLSPKAGEKPGVLVCGHVMLYTVLRMMSQSFLLFSHLLSSYRVHIFMDDLMIDISRVHTSGRMD